MTTQRINGAFTQAVNNCAVKSPHHKREPGGTGGEIAFDQFLMLRPVPGAAQYETHLAGFYLCGAGSHPGGDVMGTAGRLAASRILSGA